jgi:phage tail tape-measure protein
MSLLLALTAAGGGVTASGTLLSYSYSLIAGTATGAASTSGVTVSYAYSLVDGAASAAGGAATANGVTKARIDAVETAVKAIAPVIKAERDSQIEARAAALQLQIDAIRLEAQQRADWQMQLAIVGIMTEFRQLAGELEAIANDDEDAILLMLLN